MERQRDTLEEEMRKQFRLLEARCVVVCMLFVIARYSKVFLETDSYCVTVCVLTVGGDMPPMQQ